MGMVDWEHPLFNKTCAYYNKKTTSRLKTNDGKSYAVR
jgi:hypothetical protein